MAQMPQEDLEPLITECPSCQTRFRVSEVQLQRARGRVRCGACLDVFDGVQHLVVEASENAGDAQQALDDLLDELAGDPAPPAEPARDDADAAALSPAGGADEQQAQPPPPAHDRSGQAGEGNGSGPAVAASFREVDVGPSPPEPALTAPAPAPAAASTGADATETEEPASVVIFGEPRRRQPLVWAGIVLGVLLLAAQVLWYQFDDWATEPQWRGVYASLCAVFGCELPVQRDPAQLSTRNLVVRTHPAQPGALLVSAVIVNGAEFTQPFPVLELQFTTVRGNLVASRRYHPDEYLAGDAVGLDLIPARTPVQIELDIDDPGPHAVNYRLNFR